VPAVDDLPAYTLRTSKRARHVRFNVTPREGLVVVVPEVFAGYDPSEALRQRSDWIAAAMADFAERRAVFLAGADALLPSHVDFPATGESWVVEYAATAARTVRGSDRDAVLTLSGNTSDADACLLALRRWLHARARERLVPALAQESARTGLRYRAVSVRGQRSRWGGCSPSGSITLNRCLLFLPPGLVRAVLLHELAHLKEPNHSPRFWRELLEIDPEANEHRRAIRQAWDAVPPWAEP
jgi:hypothetical protein